MTHEIDANRHAWQIWYLSCLDYIQISAANFNSVAKQLLCVITSVVHAPLTQGPDLRWPRAVGWVKGPPSLRTWLASSVALLACRELQLLAPPHRTGHACAGTRCFTCSWPNLPIAAPWSCSSFSRLTASKPQAARIFFLPRNFNPNLQPAITNDQWRAYEQIDEIPNKNCGVMAKFVPP